jgi:DNA polymerase-3 subunit alpha
VVISKEPLNDVVPLEFTSRGDDDGAVMTQYSMEPVAALGLLKMDFLGLVNLTVLDETLKLIKLNHGIDLTLQLIPLNVKMTFDMLSRGETIGVFQLESSGMTRHIKELKPSTLGDVAAMIALFRPGPMDHIGTFIDGKRGRRKVTYIHPAMKEIL